ncbi:MAG TPA: DUF1801 domain-containing protein [Streptosporangiaceae bacterium]|jgi:hypothetical protein|nr:DUF1801 domain-containing protein [Streptosporangiaceae bacterium]
MSDIDDARRFALSLPGTSEEPHFDMTSFRVNKKIFATAPPDGRHLHVFVGDDEVRACCAEDPAAFEPLIWGKQARGLRIRLAAASGDRVAELLDEAWRRRAPRRLVSERDSVRAGQYPGGTVSGRDGSARLSYATDPRVDAYIDALPEWQRAICRDLRDIIHAADPEISETIKRTRQPYFVLSGNVCALLAARDHVNLFLYDGAIVPDPDGIITAGHDNKTARTVAVRDGEPINSAALTRMLRQIIANNRAGGWRRLKAAGSWRPRTRR